MLLWLLSAALAAPCGDPAPVSDLTDRLASAELAYADLDVDGFLVSLDRAFLLLPCLAGPVPTTEAARLHRLWALRSIGAEDLAGATASVTSARALDPITPYSPDLVPEGHPMQVAWTNADLSGVPEPVRAPREGAAYVDGVAGAPRYLQRAHVLQVFNGAGEPVAGAYVKAGAELPPYDKVPAALPLAPETPAEPRERGFRPGRLALVSGAVALGGVATFASAGGVSDGNEIPESYFEAEDEASEVRLRTGVGEALMVAGGVGLGVSVLFWGMK